MNPSSIERDVFGTTADGRQVDRFTLRNRHGMTVRLLAYGATVSELLVPDRGGRPANVVLGFDNLRQYETRSPYFGCTVGRVAFRIANASFELDGQTVRLAANQGPHHLHGGPQGFSRVVWQAAMLPGEEPAVRFSISVSTATRATRAPSTLPRCTPSRATTSCGSTSPQRPIGPRPST